MKKVSDKIPGYSDGTAEVARPPVSSRELDDSKISAGFSREDERYLRLTKPYQGRGEGYLPIRSAWYRGANPPLICFTNLCLASNAISSWRWSRLAKPSGAIGTMK